jgi:hypothetical protein
MTVPAHRIANDTHITFDMIDWFGLVVDQSGDDVYVTYPDGDDYTIIIVPRDRIEKGTDNRYHVKGHITLVTS